MRILSKIILLTLIISFLLNILYIKTKLNELKLIEYVNNLTKFDPRNFRADFTLDNTGTLPYVSGANFILYAHHVFDNRAKVLNIFQNNDIVYVKTDLIDEFLINVYPFIPVRFILVTHNSNHKTNQKHEIYLNDSTKIIAWFSSNPGFVNQKHIALPVGFENPVWSPDKLTFIRSIREEKLIKWNTRKYLLFIDLSKYKNTEKIINFFKNLTDNIYIKQNKLTDYKTYMSYIGNSKFVLCLKENGLDTHDYYETILMGSIPIVEKSLPYSSIYSKTTTLVVNNLKFLTLDMLNNPHLYISNMKFSKDILLMKMWILKIESFRKKFK